MRILNKLRKTTLTKNDDKYDKKEAKLVSQSIDEMIEIIKNADLENDYLNIYFKKGLTKFNYIRSTIKKLNQNNTNHLYIQLFYYIYESKQLKFKLYSLNNEQGRWIIYYFIEDESAIEEDNLDDIVAREIQHIEFNDSN